jgi:hypothetical protein
MKWNTSFEHIWAVVFFTVGLLMLTYFALKLLAG